MKKYNNGVMDVLGGNESLKTEVNVTVPPVTFIYLGVVLFLGLVASQIVVKALT